MLSVIKQTPVVSRQLIVNVDMTPTHISHSTHQPQHISMCSHATTIYDELTAATVSNITVNNRSDFL